MDAWLQNWIDELEADYERKKVVAKQHLEAKPTDELPEG